MGQVHPPHSKDCVCAFHHTWLPWVAFSLLSIHSPCFCDRLGFLFWKDRDKTPRQRTMATKRADVRRVWSHLSIFLALVFLGRVELGIVPRVCNTFQIFFWTAEKQHDENVTRVFCCSPFLAAVIKKQNKTKEVLNLEMQEEGGEDPTWEMSAALVEPGQIWQKWKVFFQP